MVTRDKALEVLDELEKAMNMDEHSRQKMYGNLTIRLMFTTVREYLILKEELA